MGRTYVEIDLVPTAVFLIVKGIKDRQTWRLQLPMPFTRQEKP